MDANPHLIPGMTETEYQEIMKRPLPAWSDYVHYAMQMNATEWIYCIVMLTVISYSAYEFATAIFVVCRFVYRQLRRLLDGGVLNVRQ